MIKAFIFDLDGVITDTAEFHYLAWKELAKRLEIDFDRDFNEQLKGVSRMESLDLILQHGHKEHVFNNEEKLKLATSKNEYYKTLIKQITPDHYLEGMEVLLSDIKDAGYHIGVASASFNAPTIIERLDADQYIEYIVDPGSVERGKPAPDLFLKAATHFGVNPSECIGIEDAEAGIKAINLAGMFSVGVGSTDSMKEADFVVQSTKELTLSLLIKQAHLK